MRVFVHDIVTTKYFEMAVMLVICLSSISLAAENPVNENDARNNVLNFVDIVFTIVFTMELTLKVRPLNSSCFNKQLLFACPAGCRSGLDPASGCLLSWSLERYGRHRRHLCHCRLLFQRGRQLWKGEQKFEHHQVTASAACPPSTKNHQTRSEIEGLLYLVIWCLRIVCHMRLISGCFRLRRQLAEKRFQHSHSVLPVPVYFRRHRGAVVQREIFLLHRPHENVPKRLPVRMASVI